jgi:hypothetical protein
VAAVRKADAAALPFTEEQLANPKWRVSNLYTVEDENGKVVPFRPNPEQLDLLENFHYLNVILKARQLGFTTLIAIMALDQCLFVANFTAGFIAQTLDDAGRLFRKKIRDVYNRLPTEIRARCPAPNQSQTAMLWSNGSSVWVGTSLRGGTLQFLHVSEFGKIGRDPDRAREVVTGAFNTVHQGSLIFVESTSEGAAGEFYEMVQRALALQELGKALTPLDFKLHFYPWWRRPEYALSEEDAAATPIDPDDERYFTKLEDSIALEPGVYLELTRGQKAWYVKKRDVLRGDMKREFPSTIAEAFEVAVEGGWYTHELALIRKRRQIGRFPWVPGLPVFTFWDLGANDETAIWFMQFVDGRARCIHYYENSGEGLAHYAGYLQKTGFTFDTHFLPHDADNAMQGDVVQTKAEILRPLVGGADVVVVPRVADITAGIELTRNALPEVDFDEEDTTKGMQALSNYKKRWNDRLGRWADKPLHDWASNGADAFRQYAQAKAEGLIPSGGARRSQFSPEARKRAQAKMRATSWRGR